MKKKVLIILALMLFSVVLNGMIMAPASFDFKEFDSSHYSFILNDSLEKMKAKDVKKKNCHYGFKDKENRFEIRYVLFSDSGNHEEYSKLDVVMWAMPISLNIAGGPENIKESPKVEDSVAQQKFNATYGILSELEGNKNNFTKGFDNVRVSYFYKENIGVMCQIILYNNSDLSKEELLNKAFYTFKFN